MKIQIISDLHQEFGVSNLNFDSADLVVLAGDTNLGIKGIEWVKRYIPHKPVIYILGNHEYYDGSYPNTLRKIITAATGSNVTVLENSCADFEGIRFHGATLWTDFSLFGSPIEYGVISQASMNDYKKIRVDPSYSKLRSIDTFNIHQKSIAWLKNSLEESNGLKNVVVTHHAPSLKSVPNQYRSDPITSAYASDLELFIKQHQPLYWIHGHIHTPARYQIDQTEVICNPHGYLNEKHNGYSAELIIEI